MTSKLNFDTNETIQRVRSHFPYLLKNEYTFFENAGGSQVPKCVADAIHHYFLNDFVQLGAGYATSNRATATVDSAHTFLELSMNAPPKTVIIGNSTTSLIFNLSKSYQSIFNSTSEVIISEAGHESNVGPWRNAATEAGATVHTWRFDRSTYETCPLETLIPLLNHNTRILAFPHVSNLLGEIVDVSAIVKVVREHAPNCHVVVDGVAFAPHRSIDVQAWDVDYYVYSTYKVYAPHLAAMYCKPSSVEKVKGHNHFFIPDNDFPYKFELGGVNHEGCAGLLAVQQYYQAVTGLTETSRELITQAFDIFATLEHEPQRKLNAFLSAEPNLTCYGPTTDSGRPRVPTFSFTHKSIPATQIVKALHENRIACRNGHMYSCTLCQSLGLSSDGVVRLSLVHYNTVEEVEKVIQVLKTVFGSSE